MDFLTFAGIVFVLVCVSAVTITTMRKAPDDHNERMKRFQRQVEEEKAEWQQKINRAKHLLSANWRDPDGKEEFVTKVYGRMPSYLFFALGSNIPSEEEGDTLLCTFWPDFAVGFGDFELHRSDIPEVGNFLRIRSPQNFASEVVINGQACPLYQAGYSMLGNTEPGCVNFIDLSTERTAA